jgi:hypothetical protein
MDVRNGCLKPNQQVINNYAQVGTAPAIPIAIAREFWQAAEKLDPDRVLKGRGFQPRRESGKISGAPLGAGGIFSSRDEFFRSLFSRQREVKSGEGKELRVSMIIAAGSVRLSDALSRS